MQPRRTFYSARWSRSSRPTRTRKAIEMERACGRDHSIAITPGDVRAQRICLLGKSVCYSHCAIQTALRERIELTVTICYSAVMSCQGRP